MLDHCVFIALLLVFFAAALGYGFAFNLVSRDDSVSGLGCVAANGVAILALIGACLNATGAAYGASVDAVFAAGALLCLPCHAVIARRLRSAWRDPVVWLAGGVTIFLAATILPGAVLNPHDDLTQYMFRPFLMMQSGTLGTNWFDNTGLDSLGTQSWMQALFLRHLPPTYADAFDDVVCLPLCCLLVSELGRRVGVNVGQRLLAALVLVAINPVQVNTSAKYAIVLMVIGMAIALIRVLDRLVAGRTVLQCIWQVALFALFAIGAFAFKSTAFLFVVAFCLIGAAVLWYRLGRSLPVTALVGLTAAMVLILVPVYLAPFREQYLSALSGPHAVASTTGQDLGLALWNFLCVMFNAAPGQFDQRAINSTAGFGVIGIIAAVALFRRRPLAGAMADAIPEAVLGVAGLAAVVSYILSGFSTPWGFLRYSTPILTAILPVTLLIGGRRLPAGGVVMAAVGTVFLALNAASMRQRVGLAWTDRSASLFANSRSIAAATTGALSPDRRQQILSTQAEIPAGKSILAVTMMPADFDLRRNPISSMYVAGLGNPWLPDLGEATPPQISAFLTSLGFEYLIWQRSGDYLLSLEQVRSAREEAIRRHIAMDIKSTGSFLAFYNAASELALGPVLRSTSSYVVFRLDPTFRQTRFATSYDLGTTIDFTAAGFNPYRGAGWSQPEPTGTWSDGKRAVLHFRLADDARSDIVLTARMMPYAPLGVPPSVYVRVDDVAVAYWTGIPGTVATLCARIPAGLVPAGRLDLNLDIDAAPSPARLHISTDTRALGILLESAELDIASPLVCEPISSAR